MGSAAAPGNAGEALVGQTSSSGVRLSDSSSCFFRQSLAAAAIMHAACLHVRLHLLATPHSPPHFF
ncbi:hypothetical protein FVF58_28900 [Paraburkholderia panacisoli]|uniref:Uncharacterized protein n=1 Tax=Paraburkholderia panacisoli TaxID=2603818 RepID=A0A5B0GRR3_9BURK|nr:hypothetical protein FVF58_28900 [Paraburkholderia panacisoli]